MKLEKYNDLIENARFDLSLEEFIKFEKDFNNYLESLKFLDKVNLDDYQLATRPFEKYNSSKQLRIDSEIQNNDWRVLEQANKTEDGYIILEVKDNE